MKIYTTCLCLFLLGISSLVQGQDNASLSWGGSDSPALQTLSSLAEFTGNAFSGDVLGSVESGADLIAASANALSSEPAQRSEMLSSVTRQTTQISNRISQLRSAADNDDYLTAKQIVALYLEAYPNGLLYRYFVEGGGKVLIKPLSWGATYWSYHWSYEIHFDNSWIDNEWNRQEAVRHLRNHLEAMADEKRSAINKYLTTWDGDIEAFLDRIASAGVTLGVVFSPKQMTSSQLEGLNEAIVATYRLVPYLGGFVLTFELASGQTLSFTVYGQRELTTGEKWLIIGTPAAGFAAGVLVKVGGKWVFRQITKRVDDLADLAPRGLLELGGFAKGISADDLLSLNRGLGSPGARAGVDASSALAAAAREEGFFRKGAALIRNLQRNHTFQDANKRTAQAALDLLKQRNGITTGVSSAETRRIIERIADGSLDDIGEIARLLRGF